MIRSFKHKGLRGHLGGKIKQEPGLSKLGTIRYRTASGSDRPIVSSDFFNNERAGRYRSRFCNDKLLLARTSQSHFELQPQTGSHLPLRIIIQPSKLRGLSLADFSMQETNIQRKVRPTHP